jgi:hypothetical protein
MSAAIFSAGVSGVDGRRTAPRVATPTLGALFRPAAGSTATCTSAGIAWRARAGHAYTGDGLVAYSRDGLHYTTVTAVPTGNNERTLTNLPVVEPNGTVVLVGTYYQNQSFNKNGG